MSCPKDFVNDCIVYCAVFLNLNLLYAKTYTCAFLGTLLISLLLSANMYYPCLIYNIFHFNNFVSEQLIIIAVTECNGNPEEPLNNAAYPPSFMQFSRYSNGGGGEETNFKGFDLSDLLALVFCTSVTNLPGKSFNTSDLCQTFRFE